MCAMFVIMGEKGRGGVEVVSCVCVSCDGGRSKELRFCVHEVVVNNYVVSYIR